MELKLDINIEYGLVLEGGGSQRRLPDRCMEGIEGGRYPHKRDRRNLCRSFKWCPYRNG